jgi:hypothetical protein
MKSVKYLNENGNVSSKVRDAVRAQVGAKLETALVNAFEDVTPNVNGGYAVPVAVDEKSGDTIYATVNFTLSMKNPTEKVERKKGEKKTAATAEVEVPDLF